MHKVQKYIPTKNLKPISTNFILADDISVLQQILKIPIIIVANISNNLMIVFSFLSKNIDVKLAIRQRFSVNHFSTKTSAAVTPAQYQYQGPPE